MSDRITDERLAKIRASFEFGTRSVTAVYLREVSAELESVTAERDEAEADAKGWRERFLLADAAGEAVRNKAIALGNERDRLRAEVERLKEEARHS